MKNINVIFEEGDWEELIKAKNRCGSWRDTVLTGVRLINNYEEEKEEEDKKK